MGRAIDWQAAAITGEGEIRFYRSSLPGPGFRCGANDGEPCAWGAAKAVLALARIPAGRRTPPIARALDAGVAFLLGRDPADADYPMGYGNTRPNGSWFRLGFPSGYVTDVLQVLEALCEAGAAGDPRLDRAVGWLLAQQDEHGRWANRYAYAGKMVVDIDEPGRPSRWVTLRACRVLKAVAEARGAVPAVSTPVPSRRRDGGEAQRLRVVRSANAWIAAAVPGPASGRPWPHGEDGRFKAGDPCDRGGCRLPVPGRVPGRR